MRVLQINSVCGIRSTGRICVDIAELLEKQGHECKIAYGREVVPEKYQKYAVRIGTEYSVKTDAIKTRIFDNAGFNSKKQTERFVAWVKQYNPDIIHLHNLHGYYINIRVLFDFLREYKKPVIWTLHDCWPFTGHCAYYDFAQCEKWKVQCVDCPQHKEYPRSLFLDKSARNYQLKQKLFLQLDTLHFVAVSNWIAQQKDASYLKKYPHTVIHNGVDTKQFRPMQSAFKQKHGVENKRMYLGVASFWDRRKGYDTFLKISEMLNDDEVIVMLGLTDEQMKDLPEGVIGIQKTDSIKDLSEIYSAADVFLNPTIEDNYPTTNLEAQCCGTPVITYNTGGSPESVLPSGGAVVPRGDAQALLSTARALRLNKEDVFSQSVRFDKSKKYDEYIDLYERCLR